MSDDTDSPDPARYPRGKMHPDDEGVLTTAIGIVNGRVVIDFGTPVAWIGFAPDDAVRFAVHIIEQAHAAGARVETPPCQH